MASSGTGIADHVLVAGPGWMPNPQTDGVLVETPGLIPALAIGSDALSRHALSGRQVQTVVTDGKPDSAIASSASS